MKAEVPECLIDDYGTFKYIQIEIINKSDKNDKKIVYIETFMILEFIMVWYWKFRRTICNSNHR